MKFWRKDKKKQPVGGDDPSNENEHAGVPEMPVESSAEDNLRAAGFQVDTSQEQSAATDLPPLGEGAQAAEEDPGKRKRKGRFKKDKPKKERPKREKKEKVKKEKGPKPEKQKKSKLLSSIKLGKGSEFVLTIGDEGAILVHIEDRALKGRWFASSPSEENIEIFAKAIGSNPSAPLTIALDTVDQHYSQQTLPPVSKMSLNGLLKRRAMREFGQATELQGNYFLSRSDSKEWEYMIYALEIPEHLEPWVAWIKELPNRPRGVRVLPLEIATMIMALVEVDKRIDESEENNHPWQYLVSYNKVSGVRQVILNKGKMIFTRLGQPLEGDANTEAGAIEQEVISTVEYLKRIGLRTIHDLHLHIVASQEVVDVIDRQRMGVEKTTLYSPHEAAAKLGLGEVVKEEDRFGDILMAAFVAAYRKSTQVLWTKSLNKIRQIYMAIPVVRAVGAITILGAVGYAGYSAYEYWNESQSLSDFETEKESIQARVIEMQKQSNMPPDDLERLLEVHDIYKSIKKGQAMPTDFMLNTSWALSSLPRHMRVQRLEWRKAGSENSGGQSAPQSPPSFGSEGMSGGMVQAQEQPQTPPPSGSPVDVGGSLNLNILVPGDIKKEELEERTSGIMGKLAPYFPYYTLSINSLPEVRSASDSVSIDFDQPAETQEELRRITLETRFVGKDYVPEEKFAGEL